MEIDRIYANAGNPPVIELIGPSIHSILDIGCGAGDNAALIQKKHPHCKIYGITHSAPEARIARQYLEECWVFNIEEPLPDALAMHTFDTLLFSHVLEHMRDPADVLARFSNLLNPGGEVLIAVPNILVWSQRFKFLTGNFMYEPAGVLDDTHLRFFTYETADRYLLSKSPNLELKLKRTTGSVPLWVMRRHILPKSWSARIDDWGCRHWPNLFGTQVLIKAEKTLKRTTRAD